MILVPTANFLYVIRAVSRSIAKDDAWPALANIHLCYDGAVLRAEAADGHRASTSEAPVAGDSEGKQASAVLQWETLSGFLKIIRKTAPIVSVAPGDTAWTFSQRDASVTVPVIDATFPSVAEIHAKAPPDAIFAANAGYLVDVLAPHKGEMVTVSTEGGIRPIHIMHRDGEAITYHAVMPMVRDN